jgi:hypothetical protein
VSRTPLALVDALFAPADRAAVRAVLRRHPALASLVCRVPGALAPYFPDAPLRLEADGDGLVVTIGVPDVEAALLGPLGDFDRRWWYAVLPRTGGRLTIDVESHEGF